MMVAAQIQCRLNIVCRLLLEDVACLKRTCLGRSYQSLPDVFSPNSAHTQLLMCVDLANGAFHLPMLLSQCTKKTDDDVFHWPIPS